MKTLIKFIIIALLILPALNIIAQIPPPMPNKTKTLNITVFLQGFYAGNSTMTKTKDYVGSIAVDKFSGTIVDTITVELHDATYYSSVLYTTYGIELNVNGTTNTPGLTFISIPNTFTGNYYITIKHRNHIETTTTAPVSFAANIISYNFSDAISKSYGNNLKQIGNIYCNFAGDLNQDGFVNLTDLSTVNSTALQLSKGFNVSDINGDGLVNLTDLSAVNSAALQLIKRIIP